MSLALSAFHKQLKRRTEEPLAWFKDYYDAVLVSLLFLTVIISSIYWLMPRSDMTLTLETLEQQPEVAITAVALAQTPATSFNKKPISSTTTPKVNINTASQSDLERLPRVGPKLAQRICMELKDKAAKLMGTIPNEDDVVEDFAPNVASKPSSHNEPMEFTASSTPSHEAEAISALANLGYDRVLAAQTVGNLAGEGLDLNTLIKTALRAMAPKG